MGCSLSPTSAQSSILQSMKYPTRTDLEHPIFYDSLEMGGELDVNAISLIMFDVQDAALPGGEVDAEPGATKRADALLRRPRHVLRLCPVGEAGHR